ncbi:MAG: right-handed parallel beta-helix repeat-containing protein, partial [Nanoarchaeota archaeon]|nr:right-handed parallel beta-helix repeat-containing protein [Nanoarchaeota archaeon]
NLIEKNGLGFYSFNAGIYVSGDDNLVEGNIVENNENRNIWARGVNNTIENNNISTGRFGIASLSSSIIVGNIIKNHWASYGVGIELSGFGGNNHLENNILINNSVGVDIFASNSNTFVENKFYLNNIGIKAGSYGHTSNNIITKNEFENNNYYAISVYLSSFNNSIWDNSLYDNDIYDENRIS